MSNSNIIIYRDSLLPISETFIQQQTLRLKKFNPYYVGYKKVKNGLSLPEKQMIVNSKDTNPKNKISEVLQKKWGWNPFLVSRMKKVNPSLIHAHFGPDGLIASSFAKKLNIPLLVTFHGFDATIKREELMKQAFNTRLYASNLDQLIKSGTLFIAVSDFIKEKLIQKGFPKEKIITHYVGINLDLLQPNEKIKRENTILFVGRLVKNKGCDHLLRAFREMNDAHPNVNLEIVGDGPEKNHLQTLASSLNIKNVCFKGKLPYEEVIARMNAAKIFCVPSIEVESGASEGFGMVFAEANAMGLPVVSYKTGGIPEAIQHGKSGLLSTPGEWKDLGDSMNRLLSDEQLWHEYSVNGISRVQELFDMDKQTEKLEKIYENVLSHSEHTH
ncbi:glycosyltransferase [Sutcliffiella halmapala]|uniref:glycosyltransferase n=1 Tax=Sutcliffiella halmapala TaxID=79882 RepID=UPI000994A60B|nr:glycosyltransferase [Sutcliffiella halmapala]